MREYQRLSSVQEVAKQLRLTRTKAASQKPDEMPARLLASLDFKKLTENLEVSGPRASLLFL